MANEFISIQKGASGKHSDFSFGVASTAGNDFEFRMASPSADGKTPLRKDAILALEQIENFILNNYGDRFPPL